MVLTNTNHRSLFAAFSNSGHWVWCRHWDIVEWLGDKSRSWSRRIKGELCMNAAQAGNAEMLSWLRGRGCQWTASTSYAAFAAGQLDALRWLRTQDSPCPWTPLRKHWKYHPSGHHGPLPAGACTLPARRLELLQAVLQHLTLLSTDSALSTGSARGTGSALSTSSVLGTGSALSAGRADAAQVFL